MRDARCGPLDACREMRGVRRVMVDAERYTREARQGTLDAGR